MIFTPYSDLATKQYTIIGLSTGGAMLAAGGLAAGGSLLGGLLGNQGTAPSVEMSTPFQQMQQSGQAGQFSSMLNNNSTYLADMYSQLGTGQAPSYYQSYQNQAMPYYQGLLNQQYFGTPGNRANSGAGNAAQQAAMFGLNPKAQTGLYSKNYQNYQNASSMLDQYFAGQGLQTIENTAQNLPGWSTNQQQTLSDANHPYYSNTIPGVSGSNPLAGFSSAMGNLAGMYGGMNSAGGYGGGYGSSNGLPSGSMTPSFMMPTGSGAAPGMMQGMMASVGGGGSPV